MKQRNVVFSFLLCLAFLASCSSDLAPVLRESGSEAVSEGKTETKTEEKTFDDPQEDGEMNIILIGNSYSYYWPDELWGMMNAAGVEDLKIYNVYYSGCTFEKHWTWHVLGEANYTLYCNDARGRSQEKNVSLRYCLSKENWDVISLQQSGRYVYGEGASEENLRTSVEAHLPQLYGYLYENFPMARYFWLQSWAHEIGNGIETIEQQKNVTSWHRNVAKEVCAQYGFTNVPCGDAWESVRHDPMIRADGWTLTSRVRNDAFMDDLTHDGDIGGGQYLNACVWFESLLGQSCVGNSFRPAYTLEGKDVSLSEEKIALLQNAAHRAVTGAK